MSEYDAIVSYIEVMNIEPSVTSKLAVINLIGLCRQLIKDAGVKISAVPYIHGNSQTRKTTICKFIFSMHNRDFLESGNLPSVMRVNSTRYKMEEKIQLLKDSTFICDDLFMAVSLKERRENQALVNNILRNQADDSSRNTACSSFENNSQVIITAEKVVSNKSDVGRMFLIHVDKPLDSQSLSECQAKPLAISTFDYYYIKWAASNYDILVNKLKEEYAEYRSTAFLQNNEFQRPHEYAFLMRFWFKRFIEFAEEKGVRIEGNMYRTFLGYLNSSLEEQKNIMNLLKAQEVTHVNYSSELLLALNNGEIEYSDKGSECFKKYGKIYVTTNCIQKLLGNKFHRNFSDKSIAKYFRDRGICVTYDDGKLKKYGNKRYLVLDKSMLREDADSQNNYIKNLLF